MNELLLEYWWLALAALAIAIITALAIFASTRRKRVEIDRRDALDEGAQPTQRNQAFIDAPSAVQQEPVEPRTPAPTPPSTQPSAQAPAGGTDDLTQIKGLGPKLASLLNSLGVTSYAQIAGWDDTDIDRIDAQLGRFEGRIRRDDWIGQAKLLAAKDMQGFTAKFGAN